MLSDTDPRIESLRDRMLAEAGPARRFELMQSLTQSVLSMSRAALRRRYPGEPAAALEHRLVALCYGRELAGRLADWRRRHGR